MPQIKSERVGGYMKIQRLAAFADGNNGGNPAGVVLCDALPDSTTMQKTAAEVGYSETVFATPDQSAWRVRYFAPETEVDFCGHATIALGAALARQYGNGIYPLTLNNTKITVEGKIEDYGLAASLQSPQTFSDTAPPHVLEQCLRLFSLTETDLDPRLPSVVANAGVNHLVLALQSRNLLAAMRYDFDDGRKFMIDESIGTISLIYAEAPQLFHARNPFAIGGVYEDCATGAAAAALGGYLRDIDWPHNGAIEIVQGEDMGQRSLIYAEIPELRGSSIRISGSVRLLTDDM
jgi:PhzF family phenazine biosynthesis protein